MKRLAVLALVLAGCEQPDEMFPISPGGGGGAGGTQRADAAVDASGDGGGPITGRVCLLVTTARSLASCAATGAGDLTVTLGTAMATTTDTGAFTIDRPATTTGLVWSITGTGIVPSAIPFGSIVSLPAIDADLYDDMIVTTQPGTVAGNGAIIMRVARAGDAVAGATVTTVPAAQEIFYDGATDLAWDVDATDVFGVAWVPSIQPGTVDLTITSGQAQTTEMDVPVVANTITFVFAEIP